MRSNNKMPHLTQGLLTLSKCRVVIGHHTGHNTLRRHLHLMGLSHSALCRECGEENENWAHILCECEAVGYSDMRIWTPFFGSRVHEEYKSGGHLEI